MSQMMNRRKITLMVSQLYVYLILKNILKICTLIPNPYGVSGFRLFSAFYSNIDKVETMCYSSRKTSHVLYSVPCYKAICSNTYSIHSISLEHFGFMYKLYNDQNPTQTGVQPLIPVYESTAEPNEPPRNT